MSETALIRPIAKKYCKGKGLDIGCGGDKVTPDSWGFDMPQPYASVGSDYIELRGDARNLEFINIGALDYIYSSHLLEDFPNTEEVLIHWISRIKKGGKLILYLPDEQKYRAHCKATGQGYNEAHSIENMSLEYIKNILKGIGYTKILHEIELHAAYSFFIVVEV